MVVESQTGLFGKLPAHGDFVMRHLPQTFVSVWDEWLQHYIAGSKEQLGEDWLNIYLTSPIWRFVFSSGVIDQHVWAGIMLPSVDRVGRYYPLSIIRALPEETIPLEFISLQGDWFSAIEELCLHALNGEMKVDDLSSEINALNLSTGSSYSHHTRQNGDSETALQINMEYEEQMPGSVYPFLFNVLLQKTFASYGVWTTTGSERVEPCLFLTQSLPSIGGMPAMMDGQWQQWGWQQPYSLNEFSSVEMLDE